ncbi:hypothetical protein Ae201684P_017660 [Aphanomyces euteiches]|nr:hypothetical protein Ae201684P_017660 [Aphanomyces euteiches]
MSWVDMNKRSFNCPPLSEKSKQNILNEAKDACSKLIMNITFSAANPIAKVVVNPKTKRNASFRKIKDLVDPSLDGLIAHTRVRASIEEAADFFYFDSPAKLENYDRVMKDSAVKLASLYTLIERPQSPQAEHPLHSLGVIWKVTKLFGTTPRDMCLLDYHDEFTTVDPATGEERRGWARCIHSVPLKCCPDMKESHGLIRTTVVRSGHVFIESSTPGELDYYKVHITVAQNDSFGGLSEMLYRTMIKFYSSIAQPRGAFSLQAGRSFAQTAHVSVPPQARGRLLHDVPRSFQMDKSEATMPKLRRCHLSEMQFQVDLCLVCVTENSKGEVSAVSGTGSFIVVDSPGLSSTPNDDKRNSSRHQFGATPAKMAYSTESGGEVTSRLRLELDPVKTQRAIRPNSISSDGVDLVIDPVNTQRAFRPKSISSDGVDLGIDPVQTEHSQQPKSASSDWGFNNFDLLLSPGRHNDGDDSLPSSFW